MTKPLRRAIEVIVSVLPHIKNVIEVGSRQEKNQNTIANLRSLFEQSEYTGLDMRKGPGVDVVADANQIPFDDNSFDLVICLETMEHAEKHWLVAEEIQRIVKKKGYVIVSSQQNFPLHMHPHDYFRFTPYGLSSLFPKFSNRLVFSISPPFDNEVKLNPQHVIIVAWNGNSKLKRKLKKALKDNIETISVHKPYRHRLLDAWRFVKRGFSELGFRQDIEFFE